MAKSNIGPALHRVRRMSPWSAVVVLACALTASSSAIAAGGFQKCHRHLQDHCVIDGDTIKYQGVTIRIEDIDTPETHKAKCAEEVARGDRATLRLIQLLNAGPFKVVHDGGRDEDRYGRKLRLLERHGRSLGAVLIDERLARRWEGRRRGWCNER